MDVGPQVDRNEGEEEAGRRRHPASAVILKGIVEKMAIKRAGILREIFRRGWGVSDEWADREVCPTS